MSKNYKPKTTSDLPTVTLYLAPCDIKDVEQDPGRAFYAHVVERAAMQTAMIEAKGNKSIASGLCMIDRRTLQRNLTWDTGLPKLNPRDWMRKPHSKRAETKKEQEKARATEAE